MYINYGDVDFFEYGVLVDSEHSDNTFDILICRPFDDVDDLYYFADCQVDITDNWIDKKAVCSYIGMNPDNFNNIEYAIGCIDYYGAENFSSPYLGYVFTKSEICEMLKHYLIASDRLKIEW